MTHFRTFLQAFTAGAIAVVGLTLGGVAWCGWLIMGIFLIVWAVNTRDNIRTTRAESRDLCGCCDDDFDRGNK